MSKHKKHHRGMSLHGLSTAVQKEVKGTDVLVGAIAGLVGVAAAQWGCKKVTALLLQQQITVPPAVGDFVPAIGASLVGVGLYLAQKESARGAGHMVGAISTGVALTGGALGAKYGVPGFGDVMSVNLQGLVQQSYDTGARKQLGLIAPSAPLGRLGLVQPNRMPAQPRRLGLIADNRRAALQRPTVQGVRSYDVG